MDELPFELIEKILKYLPLNNLFLCKQVNKKWYNIIDDFKLTKLVITDTCNFKGELFPDYQQINQQDIIKIKELGKFNYELKSEYQFERLKSLMIYSAEKIYCFCYETYDYFFNLLNKLTELKSLIIVNLSSYSEDIVMNLNNLNNLYIKNFYCNKIVFKSPNLINLKIENEWHSQIIVGYPKNLKSLYIDEIRSDLLKRFCNLEYLHVKQFSDKHVNLIIKLDKLLEFHFDPEKFNHTNAISKLMKCDKRFKVFIFGFNCDKSINNLNKLEKDDENNLSLSIESINLRRQENLIKQYNDYPDKVANRLLFIYLINYNQLEESYANQIPFNLISRFINLEKLIIKGNVNYEDQLLKLIELLSKRIKILEIDYSFLSQDFFNQIPKLIPIIDCLIIGNENRQIDFNFLNQFQSIRSVELGQFVSEEIVNEFLIKYENEFKYFNHKDGINPIRISFDIFSRTIIKCRTQIGELDNSDNLDDCFDIDHLFTN